MRRLYILRWPATIALLAYVVLHNGIGDAWRLVERAGPLLLWLVPLHALPLLLDARAWHLLLARRIALCTLWWIAAVREAVSRLLPVLGIGGELVGIRLAGRYLRDTGYVSASVVVEVLVTIAVQYALAMLGLVLLFLDSANADVARAVGIALLLSLPLPVVLFALLRRGGIFQRLGRIAKRFVPRIDGRALDARIRALLGQPRLLAAAFAWQLAGYLLGSAEIYFALALLGHPAGIGASIAIEALTQAVRQAVFIAPAGIGVQEVTMVALAGAFGIDRDAALSLALVRRMRELAWGTIAIVLWQTVESLPTQKNVDERTATGRRTQQ
ncbi:lysylphosphatidylglycerol synthase domain-containing protein [Caballeronia humi]|uniref:Membrane protein n=1 Tax=Caballeronia humi TaxID=326474 RepID=A0A158HTI1_9BURK|nr:lysylphosphatidylglycerol synthase domain-containing protein [Caballeronia humi]SAL46970.1 membrane protein [Caballeronia humi]